MTDKFAANSRVEFLQQCATLIEQNSAQLPVECAILLQTVGRIRRAYHKCKDRSEHELEDKLLQLSDLDSVAQARALLRPPDPEPTWRYADRLMTKAAAARYKSASLLTVAGLSPELRKAALKLEDTARNLMLRSLETVRGLPEEDRIKFWTAQERNKSATRLEELVTLHQWNKWQKDLEDYELRNLPGSSPDAAASKAD